MKTFVAEILLFVFLSLTGYPQDVPRNCVEQFHDKVCCDENKMVNVAVIANQKQFELSENYRLIQNITGEIDFSMYDLITTTPYELTMTRKSTGTPTTLGTEWKIYKNFMLIAAREVQ